MTMYVHPGASGQLGYYLKNNDQNQSSRSTFSSQDFCTCHFEEFIILAEFSEIMGPIPLLTIPYKAQKCKNLSFDINDFIIKIMSLDYQSSPSDDVQVLRLDFLPGLHSYLHYTTLHDLKARGFVRPLCFAYICTDKIKLMKVFPILREQFLKITDIIKYNNRYIFIDEIQKSLQKMKEIQNKYFLIQKKEENERTEDDNLFLEHHNISLLVNQYSEHTKLLHYIEPLINDDIATQELIDKWRDYFNLKSDNPIIKAYNIIVQNPLEEAIDLRNIFYLSPWGFLLSYWKLFNLLRLFKNDKKEINLDGLPEEIYLPDHALKDNEYVILLEHFIKSLDKNNLIKSDTFSPFAAKAIESGSKDHEKSINNSKLVKFFETYHEIIPHLFYSLYIGRCLIFVGDETYETIIRDVILLIKEFHPCKQVKTMLWLKGIILKPLIVKYKLIGLCVPARMTFHDMMCPNDKNLVTILDMKKIEIFGPAYHGKYLNNLTQLIKLDIDDEHLIMFIHSTIFLLKEKSFMYKSLSENLVNLEEMTDNHSLIKKLNLSDCDLKIIKSIKDMNCL